MYLFTALFFHFLHAQYVSVHYQTKETSSDIKIYKSNTNENVIYCDISEHFPLKTF